MILFTDTRELYKFLQDNKEKYNFDDAGKSLTPKIVLIDHWLEKECIYLKTFLFGSGLPIFKFEINSVRDYSDNKNHIGLSVDVYDIGYDQYFLEIYDKRTKYGKSTNKTLYYIVPKNKRWGIK